MDMLKLLIADANEEFRTALSDALQGTYYVRTCCTGSDALELLHSFNPDILVLNLMLPEIDGISLLEASVLSGIRPMVLATTPYQNSYISDSLARLGVDYVMLRPCRIPFTVGRIRDLSRRLNPPVIAPADPRTQVSNLLLSLGIPTRLLGFSQVRESILMKARHPDMALTKEIYPVVGSNCGGGDWKQVERTIRNALVVAWKQRDPQTWQMYFPPKPDGTCKRPSNGQFITRLAECLRLQEDESPED